MPNTLPTVLLAVLLAASRLPAADAPAVLPNTRPLELAEPLDEAMVEGINRFCLREIEKSVERRQRHWNRDFSSREAYERSIAGNRERLREYLGVVDERVEQNEFRVRGPIDPPHRSPKGFVAVDAVQWDVLDGVTAEGLYLKCRCPVGMKVIVLADANWTPEQISGVTKGLSPQQRLALRLARHGCQVLVPTMISRSDEFSGHPDVAFTNQPHREWVYRPAFQMGRHVIGYEIQKVSAAIDFFRAEFGRSDVPIGVVGVGEGGIVALAAAAIDTRIDACWVAGSFGPREGVWEEPIYRNVWRLLDEFGDAEIASLIAPRSLVIEACAVPEVDGPPEPRPGRRGGAAPGKTGTRELPEVKAEFARLEPIYEKLGADANLTLAVSGDGTGPCGTNEAMERFLQAIGGGNVQPPSEELLPLDRPVDVQARQKRQVDELVEHVQKLYRRSAQVRYEFWKNPRRGRSKEFTPESWNEFAEPYREHVLTELIGTLPEPTMPINPRSRKVIDEPTHTGYEVVLDLYPDVVAGGILLLPKDLKEGERRPVVVCQHGLEGTPMDTITTDESTRAWRAYKGFATQLVKRGFVVYAPQNPYRGGDRFRTIVRKSNPLGRSIYSYILRQHERTLEWLAALPCVDRDRIGFYGLSYGGKTAMHIPPFLVPSEDKPGYCLSICSADFNEWIRKNVINTVPTSYVFTGEYEMFEWNMGHVANHAELAMLISPRPFMVERGHDDGVGYDEWIGWEFAKVRRHYDKLGIGERAEIEWFDGPHTINGEGTFEFLHRHLKWPEP